MKGNFAWLGRVALTAIALVAALAVGRALWVYYMELPWTRDGRAATCGCRCSTIR